MPVLSPGLRQVVFYKRAVLALSAKVALGKGRPMSATCYPESVLTPSSRKTIGMFVVNLSGAEWLCGVIRECQMEQELGKLREGTVDRSDFYRCRDVVLSMLEELKHPSVQNHYTEDEYA